MPVEGEPAHGVLHHRVHGGVAAHGQRVATKGRVARAAGGVGAGHGQHAAGGWVDGLDCLARGRGLPAAVDDAPGARVGEGCFDAVAVPLAHRLGIQTLKWELEDLSFAVLHPKIYQEIENAKKGLIERNIYENFEKEIEVMLFLSDKLKKLFYNQTFEDIEFYTYALVLSEKVNFLKMELKKIDTI